MRRHTNNKGYHQIKNGSTYYQVEYMARRLKKRREMEMSKNISRAESTTEFVGGEGKRKRSRKELALKLYCGIIDQSWDNVDNCLTWVECVLVNDLMNIKDDIYEKLEDTPLCLEYETDARDVWPKRWKDMLGVINERL